MSMSILVQKHKDFQAPSFKKKANLKSHKHTDWVNMTGIMCVLCVVVGGFPYWLTLLCSWIPVKPPRQPKLWYRKLVTVKTFSSCWPSSQSHKSLKVFIIANTPVTVWAHVPWMFISGPPSFSSPLDAEIVTCFLFNCFAVKLQSLLFRSACL